MRKRILRRRQARRLYPTLLIPLLLFVTHAHTRPTPPLLLVQVIPLPSVEGRIDHMAVDLKGQRLFIAALGNNSLEVLDLRSGRNVYRIRGLSEPQGVAFSPEFNKIFVTNGGDGTCKVFDGESLSLVHTIKLSEDADNVRYEPHTKRLYVGYGNGALSITDAKTWKHVGDIELAGHPESFQLEESEPGIFVNVPAANHIAVVNRNRLAVIATWPLTGAKANFPMALDETNRRLFIGCRQPPRVVIYDTGLGKEITRLEIAQDADDIFYDRANKCIYVSCGEGSLDVFQQLDPDHYKALTKIPTAKGARTSLFVPEQKRLYLAAPHRASQQAEIRVYAVQQ